MSKTVVQHKCPNCGGNVTFDIGTQHMKCPFCSSEFPVVSFASKRAEWTEQETADIQLYNCTSCGGEVATDATSATAVCPFCDGKLVIAGRVSGKNKPDYIIPFKLDKNAAIIAFKKHLKDKTLLPKVFKSDARICECRGVYIPYFLFSANFRAAAVVRGETGGKRSRTVFFNYEVDLPFKRLPVDACKNLPNDITESLEPFYFDKDAVPFSTGYLVGYYANIYDADKNDCIRYAARRLAECAKSEIYKSFSQKGFIYVSTKMKEAYLSDHSSMYALFPVWLIGATWKGKRYTFAMNGQTGKFVGNLPCDRWQAFLKFIAVFAGVLTIGMIITLLIWLFIL